MLEGRTDGIEHRNPCVKFHPVTLSIIESDRFNALEAAESPSQARRRILTTRKKDKCLRMHISVFLYGAEAQSETFR
jgi:hypothetical protein